MTALFEYLRYLGNTKHCVFEINIEQLDELESNPIHQTLWA